MTDQTSALSAILVQQHSLPPISQPAYSLSRLSSFIAEAHQINNRLTELLTYLRSIRQAYLSTAPAPRRRQQQHPQHEQIHLTDIQRDAIDAEAKSVLRDLHAAIANLNAAENARADAEAALAQKRSFLGGRAGIVGRWAAGGGALTKSDEEIEEEAKRDTTRVHRESIVWFLQRRLEVCGRAQGEMMEVRIRREVEKSKSVLYKSKGADAVVPAWDGGAMGAGGIPLQEQLDRDSAGGQGEEGLDDAQLQQFKKENNDLLKHYENKLDQVRTVERSLVEISELQSTLASNLEIQSAHIDQLVSDSLYTEENVGAGNKQLKKASERKSTAKLVFWSTVGLCSVLVIWDLII